VVTLEDNSIVGGFGSAIAELLTDNGFVNHRLFRFGLPDGFVEQGQVKDLYQMLGIDGKSIANKLLENL
jgi:1-deoxy-D-xylulose-5-phosphate synthase